MHASRGGRALVARPRARRFAGELLGLHRSREHTVELKCFPVLPAPSSSVAEYQSALVAAENDAPDSPSPALERSTGRLVRRVGAHTDFCSLTLLALPRDDVGGLQERSAKGAYHHVARVDGALLVHVGDMLEALLGGRVGATRHRVVAPTSARAWRADRYTMQFFMSKDRMVRIGALLPLAELAPAPLLLGGQRPEGGDLCGDLVLEGHEAILASRMQLF